ncbi:hypothetical protein E2562_035709 [Oryza meyeriana var. granulata]|uniref:Uncharacterized protein n=1 Tax=Oryza meyeriana var. granulata TaxID=110450 RepID=A0A6G1C0N3_9ORYZ|nr:hypothetical protein E2562_035709 [Oryza meyeriana var. granulata]
MHGDRDGDARGERDQATSAPKIRHVRWRDGGDKVGGGRNRRGGLLRLRPALASAAEPSTATFEAYYGYRMVDEYYYYYSYGGTRPASWTGVLSSIPEEESSEEGMLTDAAATLRKADAAAMLRKANSDSVGHAEAATTAAVVHLMRGREASKTGADDEHRDSGTLWRIGGKGGVEGSGDAEVDVALAGEEAKGGGDENVRNA